MVGKIGLQCVTGISFLYVPSQWEKILQCNVIFHWLSTYPKWSLCYMKIKYVWMLWKMGVHLVKCWFQNTSHIVCCTISCKCFNIHEAMQNLHLTVEQIKCFSYIYCVRLIITMYIVLGFTLLWWSFFHSPFSFNRSVLFCFNDHNSSLLLVYIDIARIHVP